MREVTGVPREKLKAKERINHKLKLYAAPGFEPGTIEVTDRRSHHSATLASHKFKVKYSIENNQITIIL